MIDLYLEGMLGHRVLPTIFSPRLIEFINGSAFMVCASMTWFFSRHVWLRFYDYGVSWRTYNRIDGPLSIVILSAGGALVRFCFWALRFMQNHGIDTAAYATLLTVGAVLGSLIFVVGGICSVRVFADPDLGRWPWILTAVISLAFGGMAFF